MSYSYHELEQIQELLLSPEPTNQQVALAMLEQSPEAVQALKVALCITAYLSEHPVPAVEGLAHDHLQQHLAEEELLALQDQIIILDYARYKFRVAGGWNTVDNPLRNFLQIHEDAIEDFLPLFKLVPKRFAQLYTLLAQRIYHEWKNHHKALFFYQKALEIYPNHHKAQFGVARLMHQHFLKKGERLEELETVLEYYLNTYKVGKNINAYKHAALLCSDIGQIERAAELYEEGLGFEPEEAMLLNNYANLQFKHLGNFDYAQTLAERGLEVSPSDPSLLDTLAHIELLGFQNYDRAYQLFDKVFKQHGEHHYAETGMGRLFVAQGDLLKAEFHYLKGLHNGLQYTTRNIAEIIEKLELLVEFYTDHKKLPAKAEFYQQKLIKLERKRYQFK